MTHFINEYGVPIINGKKAVWDEEKPLLDCLSQWRCPECNANLSTSLICLNACHLTAAQLRQFNSLMADAAAKVRHPANPDAEYEKREIAWMRQQEEQARRGD